MNLYNIGFRQADGPPIFEKVKAGDMQNENGVLVFKTSIGSNNVIACYKQWDFVLRVAVNIQDDDPKGR